MKPTALTLVVLAHLCIIFAISLPLYILPVGEMCLRLWELYHVQIACAYAFLVGCTLMYILEEYS